MGSDDYVVGGKRGEAETIPQGWLTVRQGHHGHVHLSGGNTRSGPEGAKKWIIEAVCQGVTMTADPTLVGRKRRWSTTHLSLAGSST